MAERAGGGAGVYDVNGVGTRPTPWNRSGPRSRCYRTPARWSSLLRSKSIVWPIEPPRISRSGYSTPWSGSAESVSVAVELVQRKGGDRDGAAEHLLQIGSSTELLEGGVACGCGAHF